MTTVNTDAGPVTVERKGYRARLWARSGYAGSVNKMPDGTWRFAYSNSDDVQIEHCGFKQRARAIRVGIRALIDHQVI